VDLGKVTPVLHKRDVADGAQPQASKPPLVDATGWEKK
jgi:hypothetical protein